MGRRVRRPEVRLVHQHAPSVRQSILTDIVLPTAKLEPDECRDVCAARLAMTLEWLESDPDNPTAWLDAAGLYEAFGKDNRAEAAARHALNRALGWEAVDATQTLSRTLLRNGRLQQVLDLVRVQHALGNQSAFSLYAAACAHLRLGNMPAALLFANECVRAPAEPGLTGDPGLAAISRFVLRAEVLTHMGQYDAALEALLALPDGAIASPQGSYVLALVLHRMDRPEEAREALSPALSADDNLDALRMAAMLALEAEDYAESVEYFERAWDAGSNDFELFVKWIQAAEKLGDIPRIEHAFRRYSEVSDVTIPMLLEWGKGFAGDGEETRAESCFTEALRRAPENAETYFALAELLAQSGNFGDAAHLYESGLRLRPQDARAWRRHSECLAELGLGRSAEFSSAQADRLGAAPSVVPSIP